MIHSYQVGEICNDPLYVDYAMRGDIVEVSLDEVELVQASDSDAFLSEEDLINEKS